MKETQHQPLPFESANEFRGRDSSFSLSSSIGMIVRRVTEAKVASDKLGFALDPRWVMT